MANSSRKNLSRWIGVLLLVAMSGVGVGFYYFFAAEQEGEEVSMAELIELIENRRIVANYSKRLKIQVFDASELSFRISGHFVPKEFGNDIRSAKRFYVDVNNLSSGEDVELMEKLRTSYGMDSPTEALINFIDFEHIGGPGSLIPLFR
ncbi:MAG: hypothetical protein ACI8UO_002556 [Verrucomicrobiales bacterium]|jgi:hypothetical protein